MPLATPCLGMEAARFHGMRSIKLTGREATVVRAIGFTDAVSGAELEEQTHMDLEDITDTVNSLMSAGFVETVPYYDQIEVAQLATTSFEANPAYAHDLRQALLRR